MRAQCDTVFREVAVYDGSGAEPAVADVAVDGDRIAAVGAVAGSGRQTVDGRGLALAPGFIDVHTHDDFAAPKGPPDGIAAVWVNGVAAMRASGPTGACAGRLPKRRTAA